MIGETAPKYERYDNDNGDVEAMPPYPIYIVEFEEFEEVQILRHEIRVAKLNLRQFPHVWALYEALGHITEGLHLEEGESHGSHE